MQQCQDGIGVKTPLSYIDRRDPLGALMEPSTFLVSDDAVAPGLRLHFPRVHDNDGRGHTFVGSLSGLLVLRKKADHGVGTFSRYSVQ